MQSLDATNLENIDRENVKLGAFAELPEDLNSRGVGSWIELTWPLPGETLESFRAGIEELCACDAATIIRSTLSASLACPGMPPRDVGAKDPLERLGPGVAPTRAGLAIRIRVRCSAGRQGQIVATPQSNRPDSR